jgi:transcriptional regulator with XRE-family HTH domain
MRLSQQELARRIHTSQPRIVKIEKAASDVTLDQILRAYAAAGGRIALKEVAGPSRNKSSARGRKADGRRKVKKGSVTSEVRIELMGSE